MPSAPLALEIVLERATLACELENEVAGRTRVEYGLHHRLLQRRDAGPRPAVAPLLERMVIGQDQITRRSRLIQVGREADLVTNFAERLLERTRQGVRRVRSVHEQ